MGYWRWVLRMVVVLLVWLYGPKVARRALVAWDRLTGVTATVEAVTDPAKDAERIRAAYDRYGDHPLRPDVRPSGTFIPEVPHRPLLLGDLNITGTYLTRDLTREAAEYEARRQERERRS